MTQERVQLGSRGVGIRTRDEAGPRSPVLGFSSALRAKYS